MKKMPNIILVVMDTVRADHVSCYSHHRKTTPNIDRIAKHGVLYENAFTAAPWTPPSHASIFTGKYPSHHRTIGKNVRLNKENTSLTEILSRIGYRSIGITCCPILGLGSGFEKGFHEFIELKPASLLDFKLEKLWAKDYSRTLIYGPDKGTYQATEIIKNFLKKKYAKKAPFFLFINYFNAHIPYDPPRPFKKRFCSSFDQSRFYVEEFLLTKILGKTTERISNHDLDLKKLKWIASGGGGFSFAAGEISVSKTEWEIIKSWYDGEVAYIDYQIGNLVHFLQEKDIFDNTFLIVTSDHGENFGEHGLAGHPLCLYDSLLHIPLIISCPALIPKGKRISSLVSTVDIFPTLLDVLNIKNFRNEIQGRSLLPFEDRKIHDFICAEYGPLRTGGFAGLNAWKISSTTKTKLAKIDKGCKCIRNLTYKYILWSDKEELYNIRDDPFEQVNISHECPEKAKLLKKKLENTVDVSYFGPEEFKERQEVLDRLKALGYI